MKMKRKVKTAVLILINDGIPALISALKGFILNRIGSFRPDETNIAFKALMAEENSGLMIDVGAHFGKSLSSFAESGWTVFAFEPDSENRKRLKWSYGDLINVIIDPRAVSDHAQEKVPIYKSNQSSGFSGLSSFHPSHQIAEEVDVTTLESFFDEEGISGQDVDFLKTDTEGYDLHVLRGIPWQRVTPRLIICEFEDSKTIPLGYTFHDLAKFLLEHKYKLVVSEWFPIIKYGGPHDWRRFTTYPCELEDPQAWGNIMAAKEDKVYNSLLQICGICP